MNIKDTIQSNFGLNDKEVSTYLSLLELGISTVKPIADRAGIKRTSIYNFIDRLVEIGLITKTVIRRRKHFQALPPEKLLLAAKSRVKDLEQQLSQLENLHQSAKRQIRVQYFEGPEESKNIVKQEVHCSQQAMYIWPGQDIMETIGGVEYMTKIDQLRIKNKVAIRTIRFKNKDTTFSTSAHGKKYLRILRYAPSYFKASMGMGIYDTGKVSFFSSKKEGFAVLIESEELCQMMQEFYEMLWKDCLPAREGEG